jgi:predicted deacylase
VLHEVGVLPGYIADAARGTREMRSLGLVHADDPGLFEPLCGVTDAVRAGQRIGWLHRPETPLAAPVEVVSPHDGMVLALRVMGRCERGDALFQIATDLH